MKDQLLFAIIIALLAAPALAQDTPLADPPTEPAFNATHAVTADASYPIAGMVGQVNGQPIHAAQVFQPIADELASLGRRVSRRQFREQASSLIERRLYEIVTNALVLGEAERDLSDNERRNLRRMMQAQREEMLRLHGRGSRAVAEATLLEITGKSLDQNLEEFRQEIVIRRYMHQKLTPRIHVSRREIQRYYQDNHDTFNPPGSRTLQVMRIANQRDAQRVSQQLEQGEAFHELAASDLNRFMSATAGVIQQVDGEQVFSHSRLNEAADQLDEGEYVGPIEIDNDYWFVRVQSVDRPEARPLQEVQLEIRRQLIRRQEQRLTEAYYQQVFEQGSYTDISNMANMLLDIAMSRWAPSPAQ